MPLRFYEHKVAPGAAARLEEYRHLLDDTGDVPDALRQIGTRWMDGVRVKLPMSDSAFTDVLAAKLRRHLEDVSQSADRIIAVLHHLPLAGLVPHSVIPNWEFATAFMGSELFGEILLDYDKVSHVFCGHSHRTRRCQTRHLTCCSIGSTYREKQYEVLDI